MKIAIDLTSTQKNKTGIGRYMLGILIGLQKIDKENEYYLFAQDDDLDGFGIYAPNFHMVPVKSSILRKTYIRILWEQFVFPFRVKKLGIDVLHCPNYTMPYISRLIDRKLAVVSTFHDMAYFLHPEYLIGWKRRMFCGYIKQTARSCDKIVAVSHNTAEDSLTCSKPRNKDIEVTYLGVDEAFFDTPVATADIRAKYKIPEKYILYVGTLEPRKNVVGLIKGYRELSEEIRDEYKLVITGKKGWYYDETFSIVNADPLLQNNVIFTGFVDDQDMIPLMKAAEAVGYVSFFEGFGLPVLEAMASGVPVVTTSGSSLSEVAGDCGYLCDPHDPSDIAKALQRSLNDSEDKTGRALERARTFTWQRCGEHTLKAYNDAVKFRRGQ
ncbi:MAG: glycosyltransferase family 4 protein [Saccharofermentans sp.]|nr:glycosyltransferase family 4 protein [Saccharofermentans sp.]